MREVDLVNHRQARQGRTWFHRSRAFGLYVLFATSPLSGSFTPFTSDPSQGLEAVARWVQKTGAPSVVRGAILRAMGLSDADVPVRERGFRVQGERFTHVFLVTTQGSNRPLLFVARVDEDDGSAVLWWVSHQGELIATVNFVGGVATRAPDATSAVALVQEEHYFSNKAREE